MLIRVWASLGKEEGMHRALLALTLTATLGNPMLQWASGLLQAALSTVQPDAGSHWDPDGAQLDYGSLWDPNGAQPDYGSLWDPDG
jgi:hypothetical protein